MHVEVILWGVGSAPLGPKEQLLILMPFRPALPPHWDCAGRHSKCSCDGMYERFALRELGYQCNQKGLQVHASSVEYVL